MAATPVGLMASIFDPFRDAWLAGRARLVILAACGSAAADVMVEVHHGRLVLGGEVGSATVRDQVEESIRFLPSLVGISNRLRVRGAHVRRPGNTDGEVRTALSARLQKSRGAGHPHRIYVDGVYDGVVTLAGTATTEAERLDAFEIAIRTPGVRRVVSDVVLESTLESGAGRDADAA